jgi:hypothetical protein
MAAQKIFNIFPDRPGELKVSCKINAGTLTTALGKTMLGSEKTHSFASDLELGDKVIAHEVNSDGDLVVIKRAYTDAQPVGEVVSVPKIVGVEPAVGTHTYGNYNYECDILFYGQRIRTQTVYVAQSNNLTAMQYLKPCAQNGFANELEETTILTSRISLDAITASSSGVTHVDIPVLEGFESGTTVDATE